MSAVLLNGRALTIEAVERVAYGAPVSLDADALRAVSENRHALEAAVAAGSSIYGVTTGLGALVSERVEDADSAVQRAILRSHAAGVGDPLAVEAVRAAMVIR